MVSDAYSEAVHWWKNSFLVPFKKVGKAVATEMERVFQAYAQNLALESVALKVISIMCMILL